MKIISIDKHNVDNEHICCAIGNDKPNQRRANSKKDWLKERFGDGLLFKRFDARGKFFIEYMPIEKCWKPIVGINYMVINCLWVSGQFKGQGLSRLLLEECIADAKQLNMKGVAVVSSSIVRPFLTDKKFFLKQGFKSVETAPPYFELLVLKFDQQTENPIFSGNVKIGSCANQTGFTIIYSCQCPFMEEYVGLMAEVLKNKMVHHEILKLKSYQEAQQSGSPFGTFGIYFNGHFLTHELMSEKKFGQFVEELILANQ